ncbi:MAG: tetratricopeptide repeat protein [Corynebacteriales bacterium]|uniref:Tetratricopeptide repeat protein n=1 Tax=Williamsia herbipolensis TaxID=1603258 RepID=A0AAU4K7P5_9NOCA|nr:tetratricopeptide repeat protein [Williamsia herbipolensis]MCX6467743.1 tetratricopeptide repeat protein [Mycobacteriales bacterium]
MTGAVDLSVLKERADAARNRPATPQAPRPPAGNDGAGTVAAVPAVVEVTEATFEAEVIARSDQVLVLVDLWATWCEPCKQLSPLLERLAEEASGQWILATIDIDANPRIAQAFGVQSVPTVVAIAQGQPVAAFQGVQPAAQITAWVDEILAKVGDRLTGLPAADGAEAPDPVDPRMAEAESKLDEGDFDGALAAYQALAQAEPGNVEAASAARNIEFVIRAQAADPSVVDTAAPDDIEGQFAAADVLLLNQRPDDAFDRLIALVRATSGDDRSAVRTRLLSLFELFDPSEPFVVSARRKLASALY